MGNADDKAELRSFVRLTRSVRSESERLTAEQDFADSLYFLADQFSWRRIAAFIPTATEPPIARGVDDLVRQGVSVVVPVSSADGLLEWVELEPGAIDTTVLDTMKMPVPANAQSVAPGELDAVLVPAAAADRDGNRLGWGKGYYDRFLASVEGSPLIVAVVFGSDLLESVPVESHDAPVGAVMTETDIYFTQ
jgi:5-formyltetrahydrofolate cyclo-ligase